MRRTADCGGGNCADRRSSMRARLRRQPPLSDFANDVRAVLAADPRSRAVFLAGLDVGVPSLAALITQPNLARTLEEIAQDGAESFTVAGLRGVWLPACARPACWLTNAIWRNAGRSRRIRSVSPIAASASRRRRRIHRFHHAADAEDSRTLRLTAIDPVRRIHVLVEVKKRAFLDRERYGTDPRFGDVPLDRLLSDAYADECAAAIDRRTRATWLWRSPRQRRGHDLFLRRRCGRQRGVRHSKSQFRIWFRRYRGRYRDSAEQSDGLLAPRARSCQSSGTGKRVRHTMNAPMVFKNEAVGGRRDAGRGQSGTGQPSGADVDDGPRGRSAVGAGGPALEFRASKGRAPTGRTRATVG